MLKGACNARVDLVDGWLPDVGHHGVRDALGVEVHPEPLALAPRERMLRPQLLHHVGGVEPGVLAQLLRHHLESPREGVDDVLLLAADGQGVVPEGFRHVHLDGAAACHNLRHEGWKGFFKLADHAKVLRGAASERALVLKEVRISKWHNSTASTPRGVSGKASKQNNRRKRHVQNGRTPTVLSQGITSQNDSIHPLTTQSPQILAVHAPLFFSVHTSPTRPSTQLLGRWSCSVARAAMGGTGGAPGGP